MAPCKALQYFPLMSQILLHNNKFNVPVL